MMTYNYSEQDINYNQFANFFILESGGVTVHTVTAEEIGRLQTYETYRTVLARTSLSILSTILSLSGNTSWQSTNRASRPGIT